jgi:hypothetical protein|tara:strand:- start:275 stop:406 length:132 start_codon:yes stop_codon:yes gene_type:complete
MREEELQGVLRRKTLVEVLVIVFEELLRGRIFAPYPSKCNDFG